VIHHILFVLERVARVKDEVEHPPMIYRKQRGNFYHTWGTAARVPDSFLRNATMVCSSTLYD